MPVIISGLLFLADGRALTVLRKLDRVPFGGRWLLPWTVMRDDETAEQALRRHAREDLGVEVGEEEFLDTLYLDSAGERFIANVFRVLNYSGTLRFRAGSDYADVRWLNGRDVAQADMPEQVREWLVALLEGREPPPQEAAFAMPAVAPPPPAAAHETESPVASGAARAEQPAAPAAVTVEGGAPSAVREPTLATRPAEPGEEPDNATSWDVISAAYQARYQLSTDRLIYGIHGPYEDQVHLLDEVRGKRALVLGCGGGQDLVRLAKMGAVVTGVDPSRGQLDHARALLAEEKVQGDVRLGTAEDLSDFESRSFDLVLSVQALGYVERLDRVLAESQRVLRPAGQFVVSVPHPFNEMLEDDGKSSLWVERGYWESPIDWEWEFPEAGVSARFRDWPRTISEWVSLVQAAGLRLERLLEPKPEWLPEAATWEAHGHPPWRAEKVPETLIIVARKEES